MFRTCDAALLNKIDLLPHLDYDKKKALAYIHQVNPAMPVFEISARTGEGMDAWIGWLKEKISLKFKVETDVPV
jgi:hydrogenase nickel incorporation protein HypB